MGTVMIGSLGGGTGSGLTSRLIEVFNKIKEMADNYSGGYIHNVSIFPS